jgi:hypothetical protein
MTISNLKSILGAFNDNDEISIVISVNDNNLPVITNDIGYSMSEYGKLMLEVAVYSADFDY